MSVENGNVIWSVDDSGAVYPLTVDTTISVVKVLTAKNDAGEDDLESSAGLGESVAISGDYAIVGCKSKDESGALNAGAACRDCRSNQVCGKESSKPV